MILKAGDKVEYFVLEIGVSEDDLDRGDLDNPVQGIETARHTYFQWWGTSFYHNIDNQGNSVYGQHTVAICMDSTGQIQSFEPTEIKKVL